MPSFVTTAKLSLIFCVAIQGRSILPQWLRDVSVHALQCNKTCINENSTVRNHEMRAKLAEEEQKIPHPRYKVEQTRTLSILVHSQKRQTTGQNILKLIMHRKGTPRSAIHGTCM